MPETLKEYAMTQDEIFARTNALNWWDGMQALKDSLGNKRFVTWLRRKLANWPDRKKAIEMIAWNDKNSDYNLWYDHIMETKTFEDGASVTAKIVADTIAYSLE